MSDRIDREIDEILERLGEDKGSKPEPIPISSARRSKRPQPRPPAGTSIPRIEPATLMFTGAGVMLLGLVLSAFSGLFVWAAFAGVVMFIAAFLISFARGWPASGRRGGGTQPSGGVYWRDRYIEYDPVDDSAWARFRRRFRR